MEIGVYATKFLVGGTFVCLFALVAEVCSPKRFAGLFSASPAVLTAGLTVTLLTSTTVNASRQSQGAIAGAVGMVAYCLVAGPAMRRLNVLRGAAMATLAWAAAALPAYGILSLTLGAGSMSATPMDEDQHARLAPSPHTRQDVSRPQFDLAKLRQIRPADYAVRFVFGGTVSVVVGLLANLTTPRFGGVFAAFPAVLLASLTLLGKHEGIEPSVEDAQGAVLGALALAATAAYLAVTLAILPGALSLLSALALWLVLALVLYRLSNALGLWRTYVGARERQERLNQQRRAARHVQRRGHG